MSVPARPRPGSAARTPEAWHRDNVANGMREDAAQLAVAARLTTLRSRLVAVGRRRSWLPARPPVRGIYLWGGVGRGKTYLMDLFHQSLPFADKQRLHFHRFMRRVHDDLRRCAGRADPLRRVAARFAADARVLCLDEFAVGDIGDAMILAELLRRLFARRVTLVATSNTPPERLYDGGLQRRRFLPAIDLLTRHTEVLRMGGALDHRQRELRRGGLYWLAGDGDAEAGLRQRFDALCHTPPRRAETLTINDRPMLARWCAEDVVWFDFPELCGGPRATADYIELARLFSTMVVHGVPVFEAAADDQARRFIGFVDEAYDRNVKVLLSAVAPPERLYRGVLLAAAFERTASRLREMQSDAYLGRMHRP